MNGIDLLLRRPAGFLAGNGPDGDIAVSTRIRLARNLQQFNFPGAASADERIEVCALLEEAAGATGFDPELVFYLHRLSAIERAILLERHLASRELLDAPPETMLMVSENEEVAVMVNEEDHLRLQLLKPGLQLDKAYRELNELDDRFGRQLPYAFDDRLGYLCSCPTNTGTGLRASVMLHLPALALAGMIPPTLNGIRQLNLTVRGVSGEGSANSGNLFQISNKFTLGDKEEHLIAELEEIVNQLIQQERSARQVLLVREQNALLDKIGRAYGVLRYSYNLELAEALNSLSLVRLGVDLGMFSTLELERLNEMLITVHPGHLQKNAQREIPEDEQPKFRAAYCREQMKKSKKR